MNLYHLVCALASTRSDLVSEVLGEYKRLLALPKPERLAQFGRALWANRLGARGLNNMSDPASQVLQDLRDLNWDLTYETVLRSLRELDRHRSSPLSPLYLSLDILIAFEEESERGAHSHPRR